MAVHSQRSREGRIFIDNRLSGPLSLEQQQAVARLEQRGAHVIVAPAGGTLEAATITCAHCHTTFLRNPQRTRERGFCVHCSHYICDNPMCHRKVLINGRDTCMSMQRVIESLYEHNVKLDEAARQATR